MSGKALAETPLSQDFDLKSLLKFAFPTIVMMLLMGLYTIVDTIFVARFAGTDALSALNIVCPIINLIVGLGTMLATGGSGADAITMLREHGAKKIIRRAYRMEIARKMQVYIFHRRNLRISAARRAAFYPEHGT